MKKMKLAWLVLSTASLTPAATLAQLNQPTLVASTTIPGRASVPNDLDGDGLSELLLYSPGTSRLQIWKLELSSDETVLRKSVLRTLDITPGYVVAATGDLDGDGKTDLIFTSSKRDLYLWKSAGNGGFRSSFLGNYPSGWTLLGSADIDGDRTDDLLWTNSTDCQFGVWTMKNGIRATLRSVPVDCGYVAVSVGYYALTNRASIVWSNPAHDLLVWDSTPDGFTEFPLGSYPVGQSIYWLGGGHQGSGMTRMSVAADNASFSSRDFERMFSIDGKQAHWYGGSFGDGGKPDTEFAGGFIARAQGIDGAVPVTYNSRSFTFDPYPSVEVCVPSKLAFDPGTLQPNRTCAEFEVADGWFPMGSDAASAAP